MNVMIVGDGGREMAIQNYPHRRKGTRFITCAPPSDGTFDRLVQIALAEQVSLVIVGPEAPLVGGIVDFFKEKAPSIPIFGPTKMAAELEGSKIFMKTRCVRWGIPTAHFDFAGSFAVAKAGIKRDGFRIIKADGLYQGKGVVVAQSEAEALEAAAEFLKRGPIVMEERMSGEECSVFALTNGEDSVLLPTARDYKRAYDGDRGPNTGGMGAYAPLPDLRESELEEIKETIIDKLVAGMRAEGRPYRGVIYAGIMRTEDGPKLVEVNCRFGDPEAQVIIPLIDEDLLALLKSCCEGSTRRLTEPMLKNQYAVCVCIADKGYPRTGRRQRSIVCKGVSVAEARKRAYQEVEASVDPSQFHYRTDIAAGV